MPELIHTIHDLWPINQPLTPPSHHTHWPGVTTILLLNSMKSVSLDSQGSEFTGCFFSLSLCLSLLFHSSQSLQAHGDILVAQPPLCSGFLVYIRVHDLCSAVLSTLLTKPNEMMNTQACVGPPALQIQSILMASLCGHFLCKNCSTATVYP